MIRTLGLLGLAIAMVGLAGCCGSPCSPCAPRTAAVAGGGTALDLDAARSATKLELSLDGAGRPDEIEYHIPPSEVPEAVRQAMDAVAPGPDVGAEKEYNGGRLYYELSRMVDGFKIEAMFHPDGRLHEIEAEVDPSTVPQAAKDAVTATWPNATNHKWEVIKDGDQSIVEYHVKLLDGGMNLKIIVFTDGKLGRVYREVVSEIEVPMRRP
ncbi:MAG: hypothetical protein QNJ98_20240 [Planctomycetota bacterium]|nr:hypothetical protein [Planctomycetota bacterium]